MAKPYIFILLLNSLSLIAQNEKCVMPQPWQDIQPFGWTSGAISDSSIDQIDQITLHLNIYYSWNQGSEAYLVKFRRQEHYFETQVAQYTDKLNQIGYYRDELIPVPFNPDSIFNLRFDADTLFNMLRSIQNPSPFWSEQDFGYTASKFQLDLTLLERSPLSGYLNCSDCNSYLLDIQFITARKDTMSIDLDFDSGFRLPRAEDTAIKHFKIRSMLEWMYLYKLCHLMFPENVALNESHFKERHIADLAKWSRLKFPAYNK